MNNTSSIFSQEFIMIQASHDLFALIHEILNFFRAMFLNTMYPMSMS